MAKVRARPYKTSIETRVSRIQLSPIRWRCFRSGIVTYWPPFSNVRSKRWQPAASPTKASIQVLQNRVHRQIILRDYGKPIYKASSHAALLAAFEGCIEGHESLHKASLLHRDISINNLMINEDDQNPSRRSFLIDLDLAIQVQREAASGAKGRTGTRAFMAIGALLGEQHSFMHDLESFFWVLLWMCIRHNGPSQGRVVLQFDRWNYVDIEELTKLKLGTVTDEGIFCNIVKDFFTNHYIPLIPLIESLRKVVFPAGGRWKREDKGLYDSMRRILSEARTDVNTICN